MGQTNEGSRRRFHLTFIYGLWTVISAALSVPAAIYLLLPPRRRAKSEWTEVADAAKLPTSAPEEIVFRRSRQDGWKLVSEKTSAWIRKVSDTEVVAMAPGCTHLGCAYHWDDKNRNFLCPCHTSTFDLEGRVLSGPAPRPLDRFEARIEGGKVLLGRIVRSEEGA